MVLQKRLDAGSVGYHIPTTPRFPRSARGKRSPPKKVMDSQMRAFDLLATVAGEILEERDNAWTLCEKTGTTNPANKIKQEQLDNESPFKSDVFDHGSCDESSFVARIVSHGQVRRMFEEKLNNPEERSAASSLALVKSDASEKGAFARESIPNKCFSKGQSSSVLGSCECELDGRIITPLQAEQTTESLKIVDAQGIRNLEDSMDLDSSAPALVSSDSSVEIPSCGDCFSARSSSFHSIRDVMELHVDRDDDENSSDRTHCSTIHSKAFKPHTGEHRVRKMMTSNYRKADRELMDDGEPSNVDEEMKPVFRSRKMRYTRQRTQRSSFKRGKFIERKSFSASNGGFCGEDISDSLVKDGIKIDTTDPQASVNGANGRSCFAASQRFSYEFADHPVKMSIKSFKVPELFIEIPANATVGSLKRTVMEAVSAILGGGLRVGVLLQGKKMRDDNKTLLQAGISHTDKLDSLGFTLEPNPTQAPLPHNFNSYEPEPRNKIHAPAAPSPNQETSDGSRQPTAHPTTICPESDHDSVHSPADPSSSVNKTYDNSKALVPIPSVNAEALAVVPHRNSRRSDMAQRRIRRPFSVSEVEALVQAVEKLGTGRWRDVKLRAFDNAKHRTYVDLKDKWKTLVHTARISPQQRRGEPVPQQLLDRVLLAHAHWSQQQARLQAKPIGQVEPCLHA